MEHHTPRRRGRAALTLGAVLIAGAIALPGTAEAVGQLALDQHGGAQRAAGDQTRSVQQAIERAGAKNVILLIGDGMGDSEITIARNYQYGAAGRLPGLDALPLTGSYTTYSLTKDGADKGKPDYVTDSAASGSAWATGTKTYDGAISVDLDGAPQQTLLELAKANGLRTGNVSTAEIQDATPAVQVAHVGARSCYGPDTASCGTDALQNGGLGSISEQLLGARPDVTLGGGSASFSQTAKAGQWQGETLFDQAADRGYQVVSDAAGLTGVRRADQAKPLLGLFTPGNFPTRYAPTTATVGGADQAPVTCQANPARLSTDLSLQSLTDKSIALLDRDRSKHGKGFFLQVEGASIDKQDHAADACGQIGETIDFDEAVQSALAFAKRDGNTLVIATADHAHSSQIVDGTPPTSLSTALRTADGATMKVSYGTAGAGSSQQHTGTQVRIAAYGPGAANVVGLTDQTDTFFTVSEGLRLNDDLAALSRGARVELSDRSPHRGERVILTGSRFAGDRQVRVRVGGADLGTVDVVDGTAATRWRAERGTTTVTFTGVQSGTEATVRVRVR
ncbi:alkaline phosphatase [Curtobacterium flaccumfaciens pv. oortii]|uniref:alkaline phosphatase n=1 Tax=Curtobacterium flaccumfaciens TaxID=2035 RepID=UPI001BDE2C7C|nr:alkaline phosphatase [Curtobacterium flaccumfaciens]MBT1622259.1 alkaline phosphatase [Curtobacterium flaccumfaciens pv. oortii]